MFLKEFIYSWLETLKYLSFWVFKMENLNVTFRDTLINLWEIYLCC